MVNLMYPCFVILMYNGKSKQWFDLFICYMPKSFSWKCSNSPSLIPCASKVYMQQAWTLSLGCVQHMIFGWTKGPCFLMMRNFQCLDAKYWYSFLIQIDRPSSGIHCISILSSQFHDISIGTSAWARLPLSCTWSSHSFLPLTLSIPHAWVVGLWGGITYNFQVLASCNLQVQPLYLPW